MNPVDIAAIPPGAPLTRAVAEALGYRMELRKEDFRPEAWYFVRPDGTAYRPGVCPSREDIAKREFLEWVPAFAEEVDAIWPYIQALVEALVVSTEQNVHLEMVPDWFGNGELRPPALVGYDVRLQIGTEPPFDYDRTIEGNSYAGLREHHALADALCRLWLAARGEG